MLLGVLQAILSLVALKDGTEVSTQLIQVPDFANLEVGGGG